MKADLEEEEDENEELEEIKPVELPSNSWDIYNVEQLKLYFKGPNHNIQVFFQICPLSQSNLRKSSAANERASIISNPKVVLVIREKKNVAINFVSIRKILPLVWSVIQMLVNLQQSMSLLLTKKFPSGLGPIRNVFVGHFWSVSPGP